MSTVIPNPSNPSKPLICRRCKKKRSTLEPPEDLKYKTCQPCRELERKQKRLMKLKNRPPEEQERFLLEEENRSKQQQQQRLLGNTTTNSHRPIANNSAAAAAYALHNQMISPSILHDSNSATSAAAAALDQTHYDIALLKQELEKSNSHNPDDDSGHNGGHLLDDSVDISKIDSELISYDKKLINDFTYNGEEMGIISNYGPNTGTGSGIQSTHSNVQGGPSQGTAPGAPIKCEVCESPTTNRYNKLCDSCSTDPTTNSNVLTDLGKYLKEISYNRNLDVKNLIYYQTIPVSDLLDADEGKEFKDEIDILTKINKSKIEAAYNQIYTTYVVPTIESSTFHFTKTSSNLSYKPFPKILRVEYRCQQDLNPPQGESEKIDQNTAEPSKGKTTCQSNIFVSYDLFSGMLMIKYTHNTHAVA
ncbi:Hypothetical protein PP7435_CHR1-1031 [Komagataella phaffii CBS 7435]|uniref:Uncharacterized protein n=2 Tax=Komagataella phaffii TaxID=460519 RepID=C4QXW3_KOMPG|nr:Hypothetical protein PAS_chr1-4_0252 [Komagataella phaffii GS115]AOA61251.1 GQ67_01927T0 [Komagataella phaffii]CAH2446903.1 Hypothetical protein BQ9382_C1-5430 [Komagataella phaffii CBS 7435]AOA65761.1 GQ68_01942T0 [Komagataella phaffii GS115]CAY68086.1 Hypothetical protein PAS_chr1-4_0252 [Komagataella phaffii GS115]CCA37161.1 Hypothetical protein PP7435_CHR1-1031 [Komagataella phaffii CBS 7435]